MTLTFMGSEVEKRVRTWYFREAPPNLKALFPEGKDRDWIVHVSDDQRHLVEPSLVRWRRIYPVQSAELGDRSVAYFGAPREAIRVLAEEEALAPASPPPEGDRRQSTRIRIECPARYETQSEPSQTGIGRTIDISGVGVSFTTATKLTSDMKATLYISWPIRLADGVPVEMRASGQLARADGMTAAIRLDSMTFSIPA